MGLSVAALAIGLYSLGVHMQAVSARMETQFELHRWALPSRVYARPLELHPGLALTPKVLEQELALLRYHKNDTGAGSYSRNESSILLTTRAAQFWDGSEPERELRIDFADGYVETIWSVTEDRELDIIRLEPMEIGAIYPRQKEDRILVKIDEVPKLLIDTIIAVEDQRFYDHFGVDPQGIARALWENFRAGSRVQGASTITQQLVRNLFLNNDRTFSRKINEALMAIAMESRYSKDAILETYINEVYLGQDGARAVHGFALASRFYFRRQLDELLPHQVALLAGQIKGPSYYSPTRNPDRALSRRNVVLDVMARQKVITEEEKSIAIKKPLELDQEGTLGLTQFPAYIDLVKQQLLSDYSDQDLRTEGLAIHTSMDPLLQTEMERIAHQQLNLLEEDGKKDTKDLQVAALLANKDTGEILAFQGGRDAQFAGYNRALDARRPIGSLVKPAVYLTALQEPQHYTLATPLDDGPLRIPQPNQKPWIPTNFDRKDHGYVTLTEALVKSYNVATARLGLDLGLPKVMHTLAQLGFEKELEPYPSLLLGAIEMNLLEIGQIYQTLAAGGFRSRLTAIREVMDHDGRRLKRYPFEVEQAVDPTAVYLVVSAMQQVTKTGTAKSLQSRLPAGLEVAGKTGTTDDFRDSWFAGFSGQHLAVVWVGKDDNTPTGLTGATGALPVWAELMASINTKPLLLPEPADLEWHIIDTQSGLLAGDDCHDGQLMPFVRGTAPRFYGRCGQSVVEIRDYGYDGRNEQVIEPYRYRGGQNSYSDQPLPEDRRTYDNENDNWRHYFDDDPPVMPSRDQWERTPSRRDRSYYEFYAPPRRNEPSGRYR